MQLLMKYQVFRHKEKQFYDMVLSTSKLQVYSEGDVRFPIYPKILQVKNYVFILLQGVINLYNKKTRKRVKQFVNEGLICTS